MVESQPTVVVITTGGTIASRLDPSTGGVVPAVSGEDLVRAVPGLSDVARIEVRPFGNVLGPALTPEDLFAISSQTNEALGRSDVSGVVITAGTGIIEEGSYLCELLNPTSKPIVWTGAQFSADYGISGGFVEDHAPQGRALLCTQPPCGQHARESDAYEVALKIRV